MNLFPVAEAPQWAGSRALVPLDPTACPSCGGLVQAVSVVEVPLAGADVLIGLMDSPELAEAVVWAHNVLHAAREQRALGVGLHDGCVAREAP